MDINRSDIRVNIIGNNRRDIRDNFGLNIGDNIMDSSRPDISDNIIDNNRRDIRDNIELNIRNSIMDNNRPDISDNIIGNNRRDIRDNIGINIGNNIMDNNRLNIMKIRDNRIGNSSNNNIQFNYNELFPMPIDSPNKNPFIGNSSNIIYPNLDHI